MELVMKDAQGALTVSETTFGRDFNEALVHQVVVAYAAVLVKVLVLRKLVLKFLVQAKSHGARKVQVVHVQVQSRAQFGALVVLASQLNHRTTVKK